MDLGLGRSTVRYLARDFAQNDLNHAASMLAQAVAMLGGTSLVAALLLFCLVPYVSGTRISSGAMSISEFHGTLYILVGAVPFLGMTAVFRSVVEAKEDFFKISVIQSVLGTMTYLLPLWISHFSQDIRAITAGAVLCRIAAFIVFFMIALAYWSGSFPWSKVRIKWGGEFQRFSSWLVLSNLIGTGIVYGDRAVLAKTIPIGDIAYYNVPLELLSRILIVVNGAASAGFPFLSRGSDNQNRLPELYRVGAVGLSGFIGAGFTVVGLSAPFAVRAWLGDDFQSHSVVLIRIIAVGLTFQSVNVLALTSLYANGSSKWPALMHSIEAPLYLLALFWFGTQYGLKGIAWMWSLRHVVEFLVFCVSLSTMCKRGKLTMALTVLSFVTANTISLILLALGASWQLTVIACVITSSACLSWVRKEWRRNAGRSAMGSGKST